ncbi:MAG: recombinase family protein [Eubacteriales bacterium]
MSLISLQPFNHPGWKLKDIFIDVHTSTVGSTREQFLRLMNDARIGLIDIVLSTTISRFGIIRELKSRNIKSPTGKDSWNKRSIDTMLSNEKYTGRVILMKKDPYTPSYEYKNHHEGIISEEIQ